ncbi:peptidoglycan-binding protein [Novosphingobium sp. Rr 2-17]|uniref:hypothetical protein n=1 Tax=Novosphingobium sp. Rr 2-17 TaxID=555793 RepID=UPI0002699552|nr:hypothetical protein [Novosphingobium sp. Rr 2-17]EIZ78749.1 peptidoglycan-binding protein [Novosphingobium sp. Rr 2-17]
MIVSTDFSRLAPSEKAALIYAQAHGDVAGRLWRAALGNGGTSDDDRSALRSTDTADFNLDALLALISRKAGETVASKEAMHRPMPPTTASLASGLIEAGAGVSTAIISGLGANARFAPAFVAAATRTGLPAAALAAIVDAEAAKSGDGAWKTSSRNPRSSAAGLGQFLGGTWQSEAERAGTWLHGIAQDQGWLGRDGRVLASARSALLALRYDATASINATADYASRSVAQLKQAGVAIGGDLSTIARAAYLGHHLGTADAVRFLTGGLDSGRAQRLLHAQVGSAAANHRIAQASDAATAHRSWLLDFVARHVRPSRFVGFDEVAGSHADPRKP